MAKAKNEADFTVIRVLKSTLPKLRRLNARKIETGEGKRQPMYTTLDNLIEKELKKG